MTVEIGATVFTITVTSGLWRGLIFAEMPLKRKVKDIVEVEGKKRYILTNDAETLECGYTTDAEFGTIIFTDEKTAIKAIRDVKRTIPN